ncbi:hypothetical protein ACWF09_05900 [Streptomyces sp. NPDC055186]
MFGGCGPGVSSAATGRWSPAAVVPQAAALYIVTSTAWSVVERAVPYR